MRKQNDVVWMELYKLVNLRAGDRIIKSMMSNDNKYDVYGGGTLPTGKYTDYNFENGITIARAGSAGYVNFIDRKFWATDVCFVATQKFKELPIKYIYFLVKNKQNDLKKHLYGASMPKLDKNYLWNLQLPIPVKMLKKEE